MGRRQGPSEERKTAILDAAEAVFIEHGYMGASIREIARRAGVSSALLYWFFSDKAELFSGVLLRRVEALSGLPFADALPDLPPEVLLPQIAQRLAGVFASPQQLGLMKLVLRESDRAPELAQALGTLLTTRFMPLLGVYFARQIEQGRIRRVPPDYISQAFFGLFIAFILRRELLQEPLSRQWPLNDYIEAATQLLLHGLLPPAAGTPDESAETSSPSIPTPAPPRRATHIAFDEETNTP